MSAEVGIGRARENLFRHYGKVLVSKVAVDGQNLKGNILKAVNLIGGFSKVVEKGDEILLKPLSSCCMSMVLLRWF